MNQNPAQRQKGWGLVRKDPTYKNKHRRTILPKTNENSTEASSSNRINLEQRRLMTEGQDQRDLVRGKNYGRRTQSPATSRTLLKIRKGTRENFGKWCPKQSKEKKRQLLRKAVGEPKTLLTVKSSQKQRRTVMNPLKFKETLKETTQKREQNNAGT